MAPGAEVDSTALFDALAPRYDQVLPVFGRLGEAVVASLGVGPGDRVLDVGCGRGAVARAATAAGAAVVAVDAAPAMVGLLQRDEPTLDVRKMDAHELRIADGSVDVAIAALVLHVVAHPERVVAEMARVVRGGGRVVASLPGPSDPRWSSFFELFGGFTPRSDAARMAQPVDAGRLLRHAGLVDVDEWSVSVELPARSPEQVWEHEMSHGFAGFVASLSDADQRALRERALAALHRMAARGELQYVRTVAVTAGRVRSSPREPARRG